VHEFQLPPVFSGHRPFEIPHMTTMFRELEDEPLTGNADVSRFIWGSQALRGFSTEPPQGC
jgi:hypothetical protein